MSQNRRSTLNGNTPMSSSQPVSGPPSPPSFPPSLASPPPASNLAEPGRGSGHASPASSRKLPRLQDVVRRIGSTIATSIGTAQPKSKREKDFLKAYLKKFDADEVEVLRKVYKELSSRSPGSGIDKETFLQYFPLPGLWGERLFQRFDYKCMGLVDYEEFLVGIAVCCRGTKCERIHVLFQVFDLNGDGVLQRRELVAMLSNLPNLDRYLQKDAMEKRDEKSPTRAQSEHIPQELASTSHDEPDVEGSVKSRGRSSRKEKGSSFCKIPATLDTGSVISDILPESIDGQDVESFRTGYRAESDYDDEDDSVDDSSDERFDDYNDEDDDSMDGGVSETEIMMDEDEDHMALIHWPDSKGFPFNLISERTPLKSCKSDGAVTSGTSTPAGRPECRRRRESALSSTGSTTHDEEPSQRSAIDVEAFVDKIIEECETWLEKNDAILNMFTDCLHEEAWGLQGNALYRRTVGPGGRTGRRQRRFNIMHRHTGKDDGSKRGVVEIRPDGFYKVKRLFTVPTNGAAAALASLQVQSPPAVLPPTKSSAPNSAASSMTRTASSPPSPRRSEEETETLRPPEETHVEAAAQDVEIYPRQTRDVLNHQLLDLILASNPGVDMSALEPGRIPQEEILACPACRSLLVVCPRCHRRCPSIRLKNGSVVVVCRGCLDGAPHEFFNCWHCNWSFAEAPEWVDQCEPLHEGTLYKIGRHTHKWRSRYFVLVDNLLYYYGRKEDTKPKGFFFLEGCFVQPIVPGSRHADWHPVSAVELELGVKAPLPQSAASLMKLPGTSASSGKFGFSIMYGGGKVSRRDLYASSEEQREAWTQALRAAMNQQSIDQTYQLGSVVGQGKFSIVYRAWTKDTNQEVAIKVIDKCKISGHEKELLRSEIAILRLLRHPHVISLREVLDSQKSIHIVMEYVKGGELYNLLQQKRRLPELHVNRIIFQLLTTVAYLHKCGIIHRDLKPENILLTDRTMDANIKITDFGLSCICGMDELVTQPCGTLAYVAPEVLTLKGYNHKVDVWSVGVIMFLLLRGRLPFPVGRAGIASKSATLYRQLTFEGPVWDNVCSSAKDLLRKMLQPLPEKRISAQEALQHLWIKNPTAVISEGVDDSEPPCARGADDAMPRLRDVTKLPDSDASNSSPIPPEHHTSGVLPAQLLDVSASTFSVPITSIPVTSPPPSVVSHIDGAQIPGAAAHPQPSGTSE